VRVRLRVKALGVGLGVVENDERTFKLSRLIAVTRSENDLRLDPRTALLRYGVRVRVGVGVRVRVRVRIRDRDRDGVREG
jgi:hypothetical protein